MSTEKTRLQELYVEIQLLKKQRKDLKDTFKDELSHHARHGELIEEMKTLKAEKGSIETDVRSKSPADAQKLQDIETELKANEELLSDLAFNLLMKDESVEVTDQYENRYVPKFQVKFTKDEGKKES